MDRCSQCGFEAKTPQALGSHRRYRHPPEAAAGPGPMSAAVKRTLDELDRMGRIEPVDAARVEVIRQVAAVLDLYPKDARLWRELRDAVREVVDADDRADDDLSAALASIGGGPSLGNPT